MGSWLQTPHWYQYRKSVEPYLCLFSISRFRNDPTNKNKQVTPTPNMKCHQTEQSTRGCSAAGYTYPNGRLLPSCFGLVKFSGFRYAKTSANKRFLYYVRNPINRITGAKVVFFCEMNKCLRRKLKIIVIYKDLPE